MLKLLRRFAGAYRRAFLIGPLTKLIEVLFDLATPLVVAHMIDQGIASRDVDAVLRDGGLLVGMAFAGILIVLVCQKMAAHASQGMGTDIRRDLYHHINLLSYEELDRFGTPSLITRLTNDVNQVQLAVALAIRQLIRWPFLAVGSIVAALLIDIRLGTVFLLATGLVGLVFWLVMKRSIPRFSLMQAQLDRIGLVVREGLSGARVIRAFSREGDERARLARAADAQASTAIAVGRLSSLLNPATLLTMNLAICVILWSGGMQVDAGALTQGEVVALVNYVTQALLSIVYVANLVVVFTKATASAARINEVFSVEPAVADPERADGPCQPPFRHDAPALRLDDVSFRYHGASVPALEDISLEIPAGSTVGIIGGTGSGKSTLAELVPRLYDASSGSVEVFGTDVRFWGLDSLRGLIGFVPQKPMLVTGTIRSNLLWREPHASDDQLWRALETAQAGDFVRRLPAGLDAPVEAGGGNFSGGQRQRLTIARALVGDPSILILDDASSALDMKTEACLRRALGARRTAGERPTTLVISQRVASVRESDLVCVLEHGRLVDAGTHVELAGRCKVYREICESQGVEVDG